MLRGLSFSTAVLVASATSLSAQSVADFYRDKTINIIVGSPPASTYDLSARLIARGLTRHLPGNPKVVVQYMSGANSVIAANHVYNVAHLSYIVVRTAENEFRAHENICLHRGRTLRECSGKTATEFRQ